MLETGAATSEAALGFVLPRLVRYNSCMLKSEEYRDLDFWGFGFLVVVDFVLLLIFDFGEDEGFDGVGFRIALDGSW